MSYNRGGIQMRTLRRIPVQYTYSFELDGINFDQPHDLKIENMIYNNRPKGSFETFNEKDETSKRIVKIYPKKDVKLLLYDGRFDNRVKNIPVYLGEDSKKAVAREYTLDEVINLFGKFQINYKCISLDYEKLQAMGYDGVHIANNCFPLFESWCSGSTIWLNTKWIKTIESVDFNNNIG